MAQASPEFVEAARAGWAASKRAAHESLLAYAMLAIPDYRVNFHHADIAAALEAIERGDLDRLMIVMPPRHGKSLETSVLFPAWYMGRNPKREVIAASYGTELAAGFGTRLRNLMASSLQREVFGPAACLSGHSRSRERWLTNAGGVYRAAGVGAGITGFGAHLAIVDDPVKSREEADSPTIQARIMDWYRNDLRSRIMKGGSIVVVQTRWNELDLAGQLLDENPSEWHLLHYPAVFPDGSVLWEDEYDRAALDRIRRDVGPRAWQSLYQGDPTPEEGTYFQKGWLRTYRSAPPLERMRIYGASDYAVTHGGGDFTVHIVAGVDPQGDIYILDMWRQQASSDVWVESLLDLMERWDPLGWAEESGQIIKAVGAYLVTRMRERQVYGARTQFTSVADKATRARSFQARVASGRVWFPEFAPWWPEMKGELLAFPVGKHDDIVDTLSLLGRMLNKLAKGSVPQEVQQPASVVIGSGRAPSDMRPATLDDLWEARKSRRKH